MNLAGALAKDNQPKSTEKSESKAAENSEMEPKQREPPTKSTAEGAAIPMPWYTNMDVNNNTNTSPSPNPTKNEDKNIDGDGVKALKRGRQNSKEKSTPLAEEMSSSPQKKPSIEVHKGMEEEKLAILQSPTATAMPTFYNNYAGHGFMPSQAYYDFASWSPMLSASAPPSSPAPMMLSPSPFQQHKFGWLGGPPPIPVATSTPLNPTFECPTSSQQFDSSMMDVQKETSRVLSAGKEQSLVEEMWDTTAVGNTNMDLSNFCSMASNSMEDQSNDYERNGPTSSRASSTADPLMPMQKMPITPKPQFVTLHPMLYAHSFGHPNPTQSPFPPYSTSHLPMPFYQQNEVQTIIVKDIKHENSEDAKDDIWRNCLVCGDNNFACGKYTGRGLQVCLCCRQFFERMAKSDRDKTSIFECSQGSGNCLINKKTRSSCPFCRFQACLKAGMDRQKTVQLKAKREKKRNLVMKIEELEKIKLAMDAKKREGMARMDEIQRNMANIPRCYPIEISLFIDKDENYIFI